jgi:hypothetical protein
MPYNIALPDGRVVTNIPDDVTPEQAKARLLEAYPELSQTTAQNWWEKDKPVEQAGSEWWSQDKQVSAEISSAAVATESGPTPQDISIFEGSLIGAFLAVLIVYPFTKIPSRSVKESKNTKSSCNKDTDNRKSREIAVMNYWTVKLGIAFFGIGAFYALTLGSRAIGFMIGFGIAMSLVGIVIGLIIDIIKRK